MADFVDGSAAERLKSFIERIENLEEEKATILEGIKEIFTEAKDEGFDVKIIRQVIRLRKIKPEELEEQENLVDLYMNALNEAA